MANEMMIAGNSMAALAAGLDRVSKQTAQTGFAGYLKFGKDGEWTLGTDETALNGRTGILNVTSLRNGYVCWTDDPDAKQNEKKGEEMRSALEGPVDASRLPDYGWPWREQIAIRGRFIADGAGGDEFTYNTTSVGGKDALNGVLSASQERVAAYMKGELDAPFVFPIVSLEADSYKHAKWGKVYKPLMEIVGWADEDGNVEGEYEAPAQDDEPVKVKKDKKAKKAKKAKADKSSEPDADDGAEPPVRRRSR